MEVTANMDDMDKPTTEAATFHKLAKDAGNRLAAYVTNFASGVVAVLFLAAMQESTLRLSTWQRWWLFAALALAAVTVTLRLVELHVDARRFFEVARQTARPESEQNWTRNETLRRMRVRLIYASYVTFATSLACVLALIAARMA